MLMAGRASTYSGPVSNSSEMDPELRIDAPLGVDLGSVVVSTRSLERASELSVNVASRMS
jgi:hypothetical protein